MAKKKGADTRLRIEISVDGMDYLWEPYEVPAFVEMELYEQSGRLGHPIDARELLVNVGGWTPFQFAAAVFLARRAKGDDALFAEIAQGMRWDQDSSVDFAQGDDAEDDAPKGQAAS